MNHQILRASKHILSAFVLAAVLLSGAAMVEAASDLKLENFKTEPLPDGVGTPLPIFHTYRSYLATVEIRNLTGPNPTCFTVRTECHRGANHYVLGEGRVGMTPVNGFAIAAYHIFPSSAGHGQCRLFTIIDADNEVGETDKSPLSNVWELEIMVAP